MGYLDPTVLPLVPESTTTTCDSGCSTTTSVDPCETNADAVPGVCGPLSSNCLERVEDVEADIRTMKLDIADLRRKYSNVWTLGVKDIVFRPDGTAFLILINGSTSEVTFQT